MAYSVTMEYGGFLISATGGYPVPQISLSKEFDRDGAGRIIGSKTLVSLEGVIYNLPSTNATSYDFGLLLQKEKNLREAFSKDGQVFKFLCSTQQGITGVAKVSRFTSDKTQNNWTTTIGYNVELIIEDPIASNCSTTGIYNISSCQDEWNMEILDEYSYVNNPVGGSVLRQALNFPLGAKYPLYRISRTIGAVGKYMGSGSSALSGAKMWVKCRSITSPETSLTGMLSGITLYNFTRSIAVDEPGGSYRLTDNWIGVPSDYVTSGFYMESFNVESSLDNSFLRTVTINGTVKGLEPFNSGNIYSTSVIGDKIGGSLSFPTSLIRSNSSTSKFDQALNGYNNNIKNNMFIRAQSFVEKLNNPNSIFRQKFGRDESPINPIPVSVTEGYNPTEGSISYSFAYNNRPLNLISGSLIETLTVNDTFPTQVVAELFVLGRRIGPVMQSLGTYTTASRDVTFEVIMLRPTGLGGVRFPKTAYTQITGLVESFNPMYLLGAGICKSFVKNNSEGWSISEGKFTKQKTWVWQHCVDPTLGNPNVI